MAYGWNDFLNNLNLDSWFTALMVVKTVPGT